MSKEQFDIEQSIQTGNDERAQATFKTDEGSQVTFKTDEAAQATFMTDEGSQATFMTDKGAQATFKTDEVNKEIEVFIQKQEPGTTEIIELAENLKDLKVRKHL
ncbi:uncharacterized protein LOC113473106, partial [Diaphorina citri]|uniref:Uncharacterized protein LOC113473106 n=1 Tax=Diaphorina citri TaxID=121845 RepID=A0A3Q0JN81_DIACI